MKFTGKNDTFSIYLLKKTGVYYIQPQSQIFGLSEMSRTQKGHKRITALCNLSALRKTACYVQAVPWTLLPLDFDLTSNLQVT